MTNWKEYKLGEIASINMGQSPKSDTYNNEEIGLPFFQGNRTFGRLYPTIDTYCSSPLKIAEKNDVLFSVRAPVGDINYSPDRVCIGRGLCSIRSKSGNQNFLFYLLNYIKQEIINKESGTVFGSVNKNTLENIRVSIPDLPTQTAIAEILSSLDDKIELNNKINQELENLAQTLFKQWFIDFEFPNEKGEPYKSSGGALVDSELGEIPKGWVVKQLKEILTIKRGGSPRPIQDFIAKSGLPWVKISDATGLKSPFLFSTKEFIKPEGLKKTILMKKGSLVLSNSATPGLPIFLELDACIHDGWLHFQDIKSLTYNYLYLFFKEIRQDLIGQGNGSIFINLKTDILKDYRTPIPTSSIISSFENTIAPIFEEIKLYSIEINELTTLRDLILPKLISGKLDVAEVME